MDEKQQYDNFGSHLCVPCNIRRKKFKISPVTGICTQCGRMNSCKDYKFCRACAEKSGVCQLCDNPYPTPSDPS